jgi:hypothetical protein
LSSESSDKLVSLLNGFFAPSEGLWEWPELASWLGDFVGRPNSEDPSESSEGDSPFGRLTGDCVPWSE